MEFSDNVYGVIKIEDSIIQALVNTPAFQRLKGINQYGGVNLIYPDRFQVSRFDHWIGVTKKVSEIDEEFNQKIKVWVEKFNKRIEGECFNIVWEQ